MPESVINKLGRAEQSQSCPRKYAGQAGMIRHNPGPGGEGERGDLLVLLQPAMLTKKQAAALMQVSIRTLDRLIVRGDVPHVRLSRRVVRFPVKALKDWLDARTQFRK